MDKGKLYGVGVGPGDPELLTLKAATVIRRCPVIAAPRTGGGGMVALDIARGAVNLDGKTIVPLDFAMSRDAAEREASHRLAAARVAEHLDAGRDVAMLNLGDVSIYASFHYIWNIVRAGGYGMEMIPGVTSFCAAAAALGTSLTGIDTPLHLIPDGPETETDEFNLPGTRIWMKSGKRLPLLLERLREHGLLDRASLVQNCGMPDQKVYGDLRDAAVEERYFSLVIVKDDA